MIDPVDDAVIIDALVGLVKQLRALLVIAVGVAERAPCDEEAWQLPHLRAAVAAYPEETQVRADGLEAAWLAQAETEASTEAATVGPTTPRRKGWPCEVKP